MELAPVPVAQSSSELADLSCFLQGLGCDAASCNELTKPWTVMAQKASTTRRTSRRSKAANVSNTFFCLDDGKNKPVRLRGWVEFAQHYGLADSLGRPLMVQQHIVPSTKRGNASNMRGGSKRTSKAPTTKDAQGRSRKRVLAPELTSSDSDSDSSDSNETDLDTKVVNKNNCRSNDVIKSPDHVDDSVALFAAAAAAGLQNLVQRKPVKKLSAAAASKAKSRPTSVLSPVGIDNDVASFAAAAAVELQNLLQTKATKIDHVFNISTATRKRTRAVQAEVARKTATTVTATKTAATATQLAKKEQNRSVDSDSSKEPSMQRKAMARRRGRNTDVSETDERNSNNNNNIESNNNKEKTTTVDEEGAEALNSKDGSIRKLNNNNKKDSDNSTGSMRDMQLVVSRGDKENATRNVSVVAKEENENTSGNKRGNQDVAPVSDDVLAHKRTRKKNENAALEYESEVNTETQAAPAIKVTRATTHKASIATKATNMEATTSKTEATHVNTPINKVLVTTKAAKKGAPSSKETVIYKTRAARRAAEMSKATETSKAACKTASTNNTTTTTSKAVAAVTSKTATTNKTPAASKNKAATTTKSSATGKTTAIGKTTTVSDTVVSKTTATSESAASKTTTTSKSVKATQSLTKQQRPRSSTLDRFLVDNRGTSPQTKTTTWVDRASTRSTRTRRRNTQQKTTEKTRIISGRPQAKANNSTVPQQASKLATTKSGATKSTLQNVCEDDDDEEKEEKQQRQKDKRILTAYERALAAVDPDSDSDDLDGGDDAEKPDPLESDATEDEDDDAETSSDSENDSSSSSSDSFEEEEDDEEDEEADEDEEGEEEEGDDEDEEAEEVVKVSNKSQPTKKRKSNNTKSKGKDIEASKKCKKHKKKKKKKKKTRAMPAWVKRRMQSCPEGWETATKELIEEGYTILPKLLATEMITRILHGEEKETIDNTGASASAAESSTVSDLLIGNTSDRIMRARSGAQEWQGAIKTMLAHIKYDGLHETVLSPVATRAQGRYDMPLPREVRIQLLEVMSQAGVLDFVKRMCPNGKLRAQDILLSRSGSIRQDMHTDSSWEKRAKFMPVPHYFTVLVPLTIQDEKTGGTRVWPRTHLDESMDIFAEKGYVDTIEPLLNVGDALVFDGLLCHCGMENLSGIVDDLPRDRFFYYAAFSSVHDPNTDITGH